MPLLTKSVADAYNARKAAASNGGASGYLNPSSITEGNKTRISFVGDDSATGFVYWADNAATGKRQKLYFAEEPTRSDLEERCKELGASLGDGKPKQFMAFWVWNYADEKIQLFEFDQASLVGPIIEFLSDEEVSAEPHLYDLILSATGSGMEKRYSILPMPGKRRVAAVDKQVADAFQKVLDAGADISVIPSGGDAWKGTPF
jgi:hypothetical protein